MDTSYEAVIGLEIHVELSTKSKMFCTCDANWFGKEPNSHTCPVCLALPGALPVANKKAIEWAMLIAKSLGCTINTLSKFDRKHYFYPDLPKAYQISQYDEPIGVDGTCEYSVVDHKTKSFEMKTARITRVHLEEDTGKLSHDTDGSYVDYNRAGVPLVEIVTEPDFHTPEEVKGFLEDLHARIVLLGVSDANLDQGSMRLEPNISVRKVGEKKLPDYKVEVKNINSFKFAAAAVAYEIPRHIEILERGEVPVQETRGYNEDKKATVSQRTKEDAHDYRYFPEPDLPAFEFTKQDLDLADRIYSEKLQGAKNILGILRKERYNVLIALGFDAHTAFDIAFTEFGNNAVIEAIIAGEESIEIRKEAIKFIAHDKGLTEFDAIKKAKEKLESKSAQSAASQDPEVLKQIDVIVSQILEANQDAVANYKAGKTSALMFLVGQVMKEMRGKAPAELVKKTLEHKLK